MDAFGSPEKAMAATIIMLAVEGYPTIPQRQLYGMKKLEGVITEGGNLRTRGIYKYRYEVMNQQVANIFERILPIMSGYLQDAKSGCSVFNESFKQV